MSKTWIPFVISFGIEVARSHNGISLSQRKYTLDLLQDTSTMGCQPTSTPMNPNQKLSVEFGELLPHASVYQRLVGHLIYLPTHDQTFLSILSLTSSHANEHAIHQLQLIHDISCTMYLN